MGHTLTLEMPEDAYAPLVETAKHRGSTPEELALEWLIIAIRKAMNDPLEQFIGVFNSNTPNWPDQHDTHLGQGLKKTLDKDQ